jgi:hypothetical protein
MRQHHNPLRHQHRRYPATLIHAFMQKILAAIALATKVGKTKRVRSGFRNPTFSLPINRLYDSRIGNLVSSCEKVRKCPVYPRIHVVPAFMS